LTEPEIPAPPPPEPREGVPVWVPFVALVAVLFIVSVVGLAVYGVVSAADPAVKNSDDLPVGATQALTLFQDIAFVFAAWIGVKLALGRAASADLGLRRVPNLLHAFLWAVAVIAGFYVLSLLLAQLFGQPDAQSLVDELKSEDSLAVLVAWGVLICLVAPFAEELFFRGFMFTVFARRMGIVWAAILDGAVFGLGHASGAEWIQLLALAGFGFGLCLLYWRTQSIIPGMALHALNNSITFAYTKSLEPALALAVVVLSVSTVIAGATAVSARSKVAA
jgi:membrane protease YdiL (CAAX protease family)